VDVKHGALDHPHGEETPRPTEEGVIGALKTVSIPRFR
jgi:hypothetical protein